MTATATKIADNQILIQIKGELDQEAKLISLTQDEFRAVYRLVFDMMKEELNKAAPAATTK